MTTTPTQHAADAPISESVEQRFRRLEAAWNADTQFLSDPAGITGHWAFQEILAMGPEVIPLMLGDLRNGPNLWVWALPRITGENPVQPGHPGDIREMGEAWLRWGREKGFR